MSVLKIKDGNTWIPMPASGVGVPLGGTHGQVLMKASSTDYDAGWADDPSSIYLKDIACSAMTGDFVSTTDFRINSNSSVAEVTFANPSAITSDVTWTTSTGTIKLNGTCSTATTCNILLTNCSSPSQYHGMGMELLWTNPNPTSTFTSQTISLDLSGYYAVLIGMKTASSDAIVGYDIVVKGHQSYLARFYLAADQKNARSATVTATGVSFGDGYAGTTVNNNAGIPVEIYGIRP